MRKVGLLVVIAAIALAFAVPAFAGDCGCNKCKPCPQPCVTCSKPCNVIQTTADKINCAQAPCIVNPVTRVAETICPGAGKERNMLKPWYSCDAACKTCPKPCPKPCNTCPKPCNTCSK